MLASKSADMPLNACRTFQKPLLDRQVLKQTHPGFGRPALMPPPGLRSARVGGAVAEKGVKSGEGGGAAAGNGFCLPKH